MNIAFVGDIVPGGVLHYKKDEFIDIDLINYLNGYDCRIATLESPIYDKETFCKSKLSARANIIYSKTEDARILSKLKVNVVSLANNHIFDLGVEGFINTVEILNKYGILYCGAGINKEEASKLAVFYREGKTVAVLSFCMYDKVYMGEIPVATQNSYGVNLLDRENVRSCISDANLKYDIIIVIPHWGKEYTYLPIPQCLEMAKEFIDYGADVVMGSHPHQIQPCISYKGKSICFSMGNFLFPDFYMRPPRPIWYPDSNIVDLNSIKQVEGYPFPIDEPILQIWRKISRMGMIVGWNADNMKIQSFSYVHLDMDNMLHLCRLKFNDRCKLLFVKMLLKSGVYSIFYRLYNSRYNIFGRYL